MDGYRLDLLDAKELRNDAEHGEFKNGGVRLRQKNAKPRRSNDLRGFCYFGARPGWLMR